MKKIIFISGIFMLFSIIGKAQVTPDSKLFAKYEQDYINNLLAKNPEIVDYLNFFVNHSYRIIDKPGKEISCTELQKIDPKTGQKFEEQITMEALTNFNIYFYDYKVQKAKRTYYKLGDTGKILILLSDNEISNEYTKSKK